MTTVMRIRLTELAMRDEVFRREVVGMLRNRAKREGKVVKKFRFVKAETIKPRKGEKPAMQSYYIEVTYA